ncbi:uncharacterized protein F4807DRAFT_455946 [Annulohypoxylon truncatum]|uniref:uncharacterized protein n=1 Tax=Annulohypoxylon truncatum TaxID=327061 RepID=UPI0020087783|nr:uncharacterized protein F4807DRAFT_455946 [Annulohypoxylon truncatum]KAI1214304.1 hypothetical protein F4807DRAFT_455946 [Annulohypoxylon truncatum]
MAKPDFNYTAFLTDYEPRETKGKSSSVCPTSSTSSNFSTPAASSNSEAGRRRDGVQLPSHGYLRSSTEEHGHGPKPLTNDGRAKPEKRHDPTTLDFQEQHGAQDDTPNKKVTNCVPLSRAPSQASGQATDPPPKKKLSLLEQLQKRQSQPEQANIPRWKMKAAQKRNKKSKDVEISGQPYRPMNPSQYRKFISGSHPTSLETPEKSNIKSHDALVAEGIEKEPSGAKGTTRADSVRTNKPTPREFKVESAVLPKMTARITTQMAGKTLENGEDVQDKSPNASDDVSIGPPSSATLQAEIIGQDENTERNPWEELVEAAMEALKTEKEAQAKEATTQGYAETVQPGSLALANNNLSRSVNAQAVNPADVSLPHSSRQDDTSPSEKGYAPAPKYVKSGGGINDEDEEEAKRVAAAKTKEKNAKKNAKKKERKKRLAAAEWERKTKAGQAKREVKEARRREQEEAEQRKTRKNKEIEEAEKANVPKQIQNDSEREIKQSSHSQKLRDDIQELPDVMQKADSAIENASNSSETQELDHHQRTEQWIEQMSQHSGQSGQFPHIELYEDMILGEEDNRETKSRDYEESDSKCDNQGEGKEEFKQARSPSEHRGTSSPKAQALLPEHSNLYVKVLKGYTQNLDPIFEYQNIDVVFGYIQSSNKEPQADKTGRIQPEESAGAVGENLESGNNAKDTKGLDTGLEFSAPTSEVVSVLSDIPEAHGTPADTKAHDKSLLGSHDVPAQEPRSSPSPTSAMISNAFQPELEP